MSTFTEETTPPQTTSEEQVDLETSQEAPAEEATAEDPTLFKIENTSAPVVTGVRASGISVIAPPAAGSYRAAMSGVQEDASGHFDSIYTTSSTLSGTRI